MSPFAERLSIQEELKRPKKLHVLSAENLWTPLTHFKEIRSWEDEEKNRQQVTTESPELMGLSVFTPPMKELSFVVMISKEEI